MTSGTLFIQPHSDDMVMSSYFLMRAEILPRPHYLLTVFAQSNWMDPLKNSLLRFERDKTAITSLRKNEDKRFANLFHIIPIFLDFEDCLLRNGEIFYQSNKKLGADLVKHVATSIYCVTKKHKLQNVVAPFPSGAKQHYDHRTVCEAVKITSLVSCNLYFVDDIPYGRITNANKHNLQLFAKSKISSMCEKFSAMKIYDSQMCNLFFSQVRKIAKQNQGYERIFILRNNK